MEKFFVTEARDLSDGILSGQQRKKKKELDGHVPGVCIFLFFYRRKNWWSISQRCNTHTQRETTSLKLFRLDIFECLFGWETGRTANKKEKGEKKGKIKMAILFYQMSRYKTEDWPGKSS